MCALVAGVDKGHLNWVRLEAGLAQQTSLTFGSQKNFMAYWRIEIEKNDTNIRRIC